MYKEIKPMLNSQELIEHLKQKGITFNNYSEENALEYLNKNNYYFKLVSYRKNFDKYLNGINAGKYQDLDFKMLVELAIIDMKLRKNILDMVLDLEHYAKVKLLNVIEEYDKDGYLIVEEYIKKLKDENKYEMLKIELNKHCKSTYCGNLLEKYNNEYPIWVFIEIISFGRFIDFYMFVSKEIKNKQMIDEAYLFKNVRELRNACAHNNCIINSLRVNTTLHIPNFKIMQEIANIGISKKIRDKKMSNSAIQQIITLFYLNKKIVTSEGILKYQRRELNKLSKRMEKSLIFFEKNDIIKSNFKFLIKIIDKWYNYDL